MFEFLVALVLCLPFKGVACTPSNFDIRFEADVPVVEQVVVPNVSDSRSPSLVFNFPVPPKSNPSERDPGSVFGGWR